ncbi:MAG: hypothetical protein LIO90_06140 [Bacteroidales bacterium]|nr:hypothetical protein [Bacteroidales bacterium]
MNPSEITALRKSGQVKLALQAAEEEYAKRPDKYTAGSLILCLNDHCKTLSAEEAAPHQLRMKQLFESHCPPDDRILSKVVAAAERRHLPFSLEIQAAMAAAKNQGPARELCQRFLALRDAGELNPKLDVYLSWLIFYTIKQLPEGDVWQKKRLLARYLRLEVRRPALLHSRLLAEALKIKSRAPHALRLRPFLELWDINNLREDDWRAPEAQEGHMTFSLIEKLLTAYVREIKREGGRPSAEMCALLNQALERFPRNPHLPLAAAFVRAITGEKEEARAHYRHLIQRSPTKFYLWTQLAALVDDVDLKIGLFSKAITTRADEEFICKTRLRLAALLQTKGLMSHAKAELDRYQATYTAKGWTLKWEFRELVSRLPSGTQAADNRRLYMYFASQAEEYVYSELPILQAEKMEERITNDRLNPGRRYTTWVLRCEGQRVFLNKPAKYGLTATYPNGTHFAFKQLDGRIVWIKPL